MSDVYDISRLLPYYKPKEGKTPDETYDELVERLEEDLPKEAESKALSAVYSRATPTERRDIEHSVKNKTHTVSADTTHYKNKSIEKVKHIVTGVNRKGSSFSVGEGRFYPKSKKMTKSKAAVQHNKMIDLQPGTFGTSESAPTDSTYLAKFKKTGAVKMPE